MKSYILRLLAGMFAVTYIFVLSCCDKRNETGMFNISDESANIIDVVTENYSDEDMFDKIDTEKYTLDKLNKLYPVEFIKKYKRADDSYVDNVAYMTSYGYIILYYDKSGNYEFGKDIITEKSLKEFDVINIGDSVDDVQKFDENGEFLFLYTGCIDVPKISQHYTTDGYMVMVYYDSDYSVTKIENRLI